MSGAHYPRTRCFTIVWMVLLAQACDSGDDVDRTHQTPEESFLTVLDELTTLPGSEPLWTGGVLDGDRCEGLGEITEVAVAARHVVVLDRRARTVKVFSEEHGCLEEVGGAGEGPGEFQSPVAMDLAGDSVLTVVDSGRRHMERFGARDGRWHHLSSMRLPFAPSGVCVMDGALFMTGPHEGRMVHRMRPASESPGLSFGSWYEGVDPTVRSFLESRPLRLACDGESSTLIAVSELTGEVEVYTTEGRIRYAGRLPGFVGFAVVRLESGAVSLTVPDEAEGAPHSVASVVVAAPGVALVQYGVRTGDGVEDVASVLVDLADGRMELSGGVLPVIRAVGDDLLVIEEESGFPRFAVYARRGAFERAGHR